MTLLHRKLLPEQVSNQTSCSYDYDCDYLYVYWPPPPPQQLPPPSSTTTNDTTTTFISPYLIVMVSLITSAVLFTIYYFIFIRYCTRSRQVSATEFDERSQDINVQDPQPEHDYPIWYINTVGLQPAVINSIRVVKFKRGNHSLTDVTDCLICLSEFEDDEFLRLLPKCNHAFHISCIDTWLRSHTNCPLCRAAVVVSNDGHAITRSSDRDMYPGFGLDQNTRVVNARNDGERGSDDDRDREHEEHRIEVHDLKPDVVCLRRSFSMDSNSSSSGIHLQRLNHLRDSRTRRMMMMVRSCSYGGRSIRY